MRWTHVYIRCEGWVWERLSTAAWSAMAHWKGVVVTTCVGVGGWYMPPVTRAIWAPVPVPLPMESVVGGGPSTTVVEVPEPSTAALLLVGVTGLLIIRRV